MKNALLTLTLLLAATPVLAKTQMSVGYNEEGTAPSVFDITDKTTLVFTQQPAALTVKADGTAVGEPIALSAIKSITFGGDWTGIDGITAGLEAQGGLHLRQNPVDDTLEVLTTATGDLTVYALSGAKALTVKAWAGQPVNVSALPQGIYIVKVADQSAKFIKK